MGKAVEPEPPLDFQGEQRVVIRDVDWEGYQTILRMVGDGHTRLTYDGHDLELMSSSFGDESLRCLLRRLLEIVAVELNIPFRSLGATTWCNQAANCGLEADECFDFIDIPGQIPTRPDLAIDIAITPSAVCRLAAYAGLGVPEVWIFDGKSLVINCLQPNGSYKSVPRSVAFPSLTPKLITKWVLDGIKGGDHSAWARRFRGWVLAELVPPGSS